jgi:hypothetical protein
MSDPIRAALEKAAEEVLKNLKDRRGIRQAIEQCDADVQAEIGRTAAAGAIVTFLRNLPKGNVEVPQPGIPDRLVLGMNHIHARNLAVAVLELVEEQSYEPSSSP